MSALEAPLADMRPDDVGSLSAIEHVEIVFRLRTRPTRREKFSTDSSYRLFDRLNAAGERGEHVELFTHGARSLSPASIDALNCYLRNCRGLRYWKRRWAPWRDTKWGWKNFMGHLALKFNDNA